MLQYILKAAAVEQTLLQHDCCGSGNNGAVKKEGKLGADRHIIVSKSEFIFGGERRQM